MSPVNLRGARTRTTSASPYARGKLAAAIAATLAMPGIGVQEARAQEAEEQALEESLVTGSRIVRRDFTSEQPDPDTRLRAHSSMQVLDRDRVRPEPAAAVRARGHRPHAGRGQASSSTTVPRSPRAPRRSSLRGLGPNRNLVLLDGYRAMPVNATMAVDLNTIPRPPRRARRGDHGRRLVGVRRGRRRGRRQLHFEEGLRGRGPRLQYGSMQNGHAPEKRASALFGMNSSNSRGNVMLGIEYAERGAVERKDADFCVRRCGSHGTGHDLDHD